MLPSFVCFLSFYPFFWGGGGLVRFCSRVSTSSHLLDNSAIIRSYLNISSSEVEDGGLYCCSVLHPAMGAGQLDYLDTFQLNGQEQHCARLNVYGIPVIRWAGNKTAVAGQDYNLDCPFAGYPVQSVTWLRAGQVSWFIFIQLVGQFDFCF